MTLAPSGGGVVETRGQVEVVEDWRSGEGFRNDGLLQNLNNTLSEITYIDCVIIALIQTSSYRSVRRF